jgi:alpha-beta hydrolase superfamily lysophospholipase
MGRLATLLPSARRARTLSLPAILFAVSVSAASASPWMRQTFSIHGREQTLYLSGPPDGQPIVVSSGDGGWLHLAPHVAEVLAAHGFFVVGFDVKTYLSESTSRDGMLHAQDEAADYEALARFASQKSGKKPIVLGVSEGAGLSVLAATDPQTKTAISGVIGLGLPDQNELAWRWKDAVIYLTHRPANEPSFSAAAIIAKVAPLPVALIQSSEDEFVSMAEAKRLYEAASEPKRFWLIEASDHRFSNNLADCDARLLEAVAWVLQHSADRR